MRKSDERTSGDARSFLGDVHGIPESPIRSSDRCPKAQAQVVDEMLTTLFEQVRSMNLDPRDFAIFGSGPLAIRGIIPTCNDLDIICRGEVWRAVKAKGDVEYLPDYDVSVAKMYGGAISFGTHWGIGTFDIDELIDAAELIDELPFVRLEHVFRYKTIRASLKDLAHLKALAVFGA